MARVIAMLFHPFVHAQSPASGIAAQQPISARKGVIRKQVTPKWVDGVLITILALIIVIAIVALVPKLWGRDIKWTGTGQGSWSMAREGGVMPCSLFYVSRTNEYHEGDIVSFWYSSRFATSDESSIKRIVWVKADGTLICRGDNTKNSDSGEYIVPRNKVRGKVIGSRISAMPTTYWRWLSMGWTLQTEEIAERERKLFSVATLTSVFTASGRVRNWVEFNYAPHLVNWSPTGDYVAVRREDHVTDIYSSSRVPVMSMKGRFKMWIDEKSFVSVSGTTVSRVTVPDGKKTPWAITPTMLGMGFQQNGIVLIDGPADVRAGDTIQFRSHPETLGRVKAVSRERKGGMWGLVTVVKLDPPLPFRPQFGEGITRIRA